MRSFLNRHSFVIASAAAMAAAWMVGARVGGLAAPVGVAGVGLAFAVAQSRLRGGASSVESWQEVGLLAGRGTPLLLFFYSDTWAASLAAQPMVNGLERELGARARVIRLNVADRAGQEGRRAYEVAQVPAIILLDAAGHPVYRIEGRLPDRGAILRALT